MHMLFEDDGIILFADPHRRREGVRFRNFVNRFQIVAFVLHNKELACSVRTHGFNRKRRCGQNRAGVGTKSKPRWHPVLKYFENDGSRRGRDLVGLVMVMMVMASMRVSVTMTVAMMLATTQQPGACDINGEAEAGNRNSLGKMNRSGIENAADRFVAYQQRDHGQDDGAGVSGEI